MTRIAPVRVLTGVIGTALCIAQAALAVAQVTQRPIARVGDEWQFVVYYAVSSEVPNRAWRITSVDDTSIEGTEDGQRLRLTQDLNPIDSPRRSDTHPRALDFPIYVGRRWSYVTDTHFKDNNSTARSEITATVTAYEKIRVVGGEFDTFKIVATGRFNGLSKGGPGILRGESTATYWYAPAARTIVKSLSKNAYRGETTVELVSMQLRD